MPRQVRIARLLLTVVAFAHVVAIVALVALQGLLADQISSGQPGLSPEDLSKLVLVELMRTVSFHVLLVIVCGIYAVKIRSGSRRVFRIVLASQVLSVIFGVLTWLISPDVVRFMTPPFVLAALVILMLLLGSASTRAFFKAREPIDDASTSSR